ncbi:hypothetical protein Tco_0324921 [Tanacetum coccineum]
MMMIATIQEAAKEDRSIRMSKLNFKEDEEASGEDKDKEEEHLAPTDSVALPAIDPIPLAEETKPFEKGKARKTVRLQPPMAASIKPLNAEFASAPTPPSPPPSPIFPWSSPLPQIPSPLILVLSPLLPLPSPPTHTSPTYADAPLGYKAAMIQSRATSPLPVPSPPFLLPSVDRRSDIPETNMPFQKRLCLTAPDSRFEVGESSIVYTLARRVDYGFIDTIDMSLYGCLEKGRYGILTEVNTAYQGFLGAQIRRIFLDGYGVLDVRIVIFKCLEFGRYGVLTEVNTAYRGFLGVETTFDIFQNILLLYLEYGVWIFSRYGALDLVPSWSFVKCRHRYVVSSLMDTAYRMSEQ